MAAAAAMLRPFYIEKNDVKVDYTDATGKPTSVDLPLVTLPAGTVVFRAMKIPNPAKGEDVRHFYRDYLGNTEGSRICLSPLHNVFFYPFPYIAFGAHTVGSTFTMMQISVLVHPVTVVCAMSPSDFVRGRALRYDGEAPWQRCSNFAGPGVECHPRTGAEQLCEARVPGEFWCARMDGDCGSRFLESGCDGRHSQEAGNQQDDADERLSPAFTPDVA